MEVCANVAGLMSSVDIIDAILKRNIVILPFDNNSLTGIGYNLSSTDFVLSTQKGALLTIHTAGQERYTYIDPHDTVLTLTREYIQVDNTIAGTFHAKVGMVSLGFGHISTTLDPGWKGQLLISLNNPTNKRIKFTVSKQGSLCTLLFYKLITQAENVSGKEAHDNDKGRAAFLKQYIAAPPRVANKYFSEPYNQLREYINKELASYLDGSSNETNEKIDILKEQYDVVKKILQSISENSLVLSAGGVLYLDTALIDTVKRIDFFKIKMDHFLSPSEFADEFFAVPITSEMLSSEGNRKIVQDNFELLKYHIEMEIMKERHLSRIDKQNAAAEKLMRPCKKIRIAGFLRKNMLSMLLMLLFLMSTAGILYVNSLDPTALTWFQSMIKAANAVPALISLAGLFFSVLRK